MKVKDVIERLNEIGYDEETELFLYLNAECGETYELKVEEVIDERMDDCVRENMVSVLFETPDDGFLQLLCEHRFESLRDDLSNIIARYCL